MSSMTVGQVASRWHRPGARLDYLFDWSKYLGVDDVLTNKTVTIETEAGSTMTADTGTIVNDSTGVLVWVEGGVLEERAIVRCEIASQDGRTDTLSLELVVGYRY